MKRYFPYSLNALAIAVLALAAADASADPSPSSASQGCSGSAGDGSCHGGEDALVALQLRRGSRREPASGTAADGCDLRALTFEGGGFVSVSTQFATLVGLLGALKTQQGAARASLDVLFECFGSLLSVSGGTYFLTSLIYSAGFLDLLNEIADSPTEAEALFETGYTDKVSVASFASCRPPTCNWIKTVTDCLQGTASINTMDPLGSTPNDFARGKQFIAGSSIATPTSEVFVFQGSDSRERCTFRVLTPDGNPPATKFLPVRFSVRVEGDETLPAPFPFCADSTCFDLQIRFTCTAANGMTFDSGSVPMAGGFPTAFVEAAGRLPISLVAAASSSVFQGFILSDASAPDATFLPGAWVSNAGNGQTFQVAQDSLNALFRSVSQASVDSLTSGTVLPVFDGTYTDDTAISQAVATGATEVTALLNSETNFLRIFTDGSNLGSGKFETYSLPIFSLTADSARAWFGSAQKLKIPPAASLVTGITYGSLDLTTVQNDYYGIQAGQSVKLNVFAYELLPNVLPDLPSIGQASASIYAEALGDIVTTLTDSSNSEAMQSILTEFFLR